MSFADGHAHSILARKPEEDATCCPLMVIVLVSSRMGEALVQMIMKSL